jgi:serine/threonine protein kinase
MRNKVCPYIAKYYCKSETEVPFSDGEIYLEYYPNNLGESRLKEERKMKIIEDVGMGLLFITDEKLIHRDLKEVNIMVDRYHRGRLIDFGSASNISGSTKFKTIDEKVRSTVGYYVTYG